MCSLCFKGKNGFVDFIKADVLTCLCGSFKDKQKEACSLSGSNTVNESGESTNKGKLHVHDDNPWL